jgi:plasmid stabilization system protein ParE
MNVHWTKTAQDHLAGINNYIAHILADQIDVLAVVHEARNILNNQ